MDTLATDDKAAGFVVDIVDADTAIHHASPKRLAAVQG
jgi:hypothetical protein